ncbi:mannitol-1-phosphate 5-dehydrogenase [Paenibacillus allorhizosphaerae]|uniref:Mannitol-1-phosphate 5-dehydrogenase n=1 Tax=Paenibacillus allorhizosphaerae TaxID=2849866 RepID=A0ABM8VQB2_9BACL|nr:mannitol-1-phosphate 5-dehydrogenase [Paenibacillus allorhizosphaerae]CAG7654016.1 Mannitol-1-phosphate 5-dehydrogenase [Paenibacillus allorhizosphaerae]
MKALHFGAGNIGRGFIGLLLSQSGYEVIFSDVNKTVVTELQQRGEYTVTLASAAREQLHVTGVTAIDGTDANTVTSAVAEVDLITTAVGVNILKHIAAGIASGIEKRIANGAGRLHIIACENAIGGSTQLKELVYALLDDTTKAKASEVIAFPDAAVDRIVPLQHHEDPLAVMVEPFYEWVVDASAMFEGYRPVKGVHYVQNLLPYIERKLFTVNTGHCAAAYLGGLKGYETIQQAMADEEIVSAVKATLKETGAVLVARYDFDKTEHDQYIDKIIGRFRNDQLTDEVTRVGRSPIRKLSPNDRLVKPAMQAHELGMSPVQLAKVMAAALCFDHADDPESAELQQSIRDKGVGQTIADYTSIPEGHPVYNLVLESYGSIADQRK